MEVVRTKSAPAEFAGAHARHVPARVAPRIVKDWNFVRSYVIKDGHLFLSLMADGGIYEFEPMTGAK
jgi:hypothetical protein